jgi:hypothetical protein
MAVKSALSLLALVLFVMLPSASDTASDRMSSQPSDLSHRKDNSPPQSKPGRASATMEPRVQPQRNHRWQ